MAANLVFLTDRCKGCGLCVSVCPRHILTIDCTLINMKGYHPAACTDMTACIGCASCAMMCPDSVISVYRQEAGTDGIIAAGDYLGTGDEAPMRSAL